MAPTSGDPAIDLILRIQTEQKKEMEAKLKILEIKIETLFKTVGYLVRDVKKLQEGEKKWMILNR